MKRVAVAAVAGSFFAGTGVAPISAQTGGIETRTIEYREDGVTYRGYLAKPAGATDAPGVLVVHEWWGLNDYAKKRADMLAELGYVAFAADMYGEGKTTTDAAEAKALAGPLYGDRAEFRDRVEEGLEVLEEIDGVDDDRLAAIGYCFGGTAALELAYAEADDDDDDADLRGVVSFHGNPLPPLPGDDRITARVLLLHGGDDPMVKTADVEAVAAAIRERKGDAKVVVYPGAQHSFTNPAVDGLKLEGATYNQAADEQSWRAMQAFLGEVLKKE